MKKVFMIAALAAAMYSCKNDKNEEKCGSSCCKGDKQERKKCNPDAVADMHNAHSSLDYAGTYTGSLPTASGEGMEVSITLKKDGVYEKTIKYIGKEGTFRDTGHYTWNKAKNTIILAGIKDAPNQYFVGENSLTQLDMDGNKITGNFADSYILKKK